MRLGKIAQLQKKYDFAWKVYSEGVGVGTTHGMAGSPEMQVSHRDAS